jgi:hypothetical protein
MRSDSMNKKYKCAKCKDTGRVLIPFLGGSELEAECECVSKPAIDVELKGVKFQVETT